MANSKKQGKLRDRIVDYFTERGKPAHREKVAEGIEGKPGSVFKELSRLSKSGVLQQLGGGQYNLVDTSIEGTDTPQVAKNLRSEAENIATLNRLLSLYDTLLDGISVSIESDDWAAVDKRVQAIKSLRSLASTIDQLLKRYNLISKGYDANTRQAVEDAKHKTADREKQELENASPEEQLEVVGDYDESMRELLEVLPEPIKQKVTV